jgi:hypothetical protein
VAIQTAAHGGWNSGRSERFFSTSAFTLLNVLREMIWRAASRVARPGSIIEIYTSSGKLVER